MSDQQILPMTEAEMETYRLHRRFDRMGRLVGDSAMEKLFRTHVMVIGIGGVGSFAAEALARSGVGKITLVDFDEVCITNFNRQLHALQGLVGEKKANVMVERMLKINPQASIHAIPKFYNERLSEEIFTEAAALQGGQKPDFVIDAIDSVTPKCHLLAKCIKDGVRVITSTGSGGKMDTTRIQVTDLGQTQKDPLAKAIRRILRDQYGFPQTGDFNIPAIFSDEPTRAPLELNYDGGKGFRCVCSQENEFFNCDNRNVILGNASFVTGAFGLACVSVVVREITNTPDHG